MSLFSDAKCARCRRAGVKLFLKGDKCYTPKCPVVRRKYPPGQHGLKSARRRPTSYGKQLLEKQKVKIMYGLRERQMVSYYDKARVMTGDVGKNFLSQLEQRLDNVVYRLGYARSRDAARQLVGHGHLTVNGKKVTVPSIQVRPGDEIAVRKTSESRAPFNDLGKKMVSVELPVWLVWDAGQSKGKVMDRPSIDELMNEVDVRSIIEYYSK